MNTIDNLLFKIRGRLLILAVKLGEWIDKYIMLNDKSDQSQ